MRGRYFILIIVMLSVGSVAEGQQSISATQVVHRDVPLSSPWLFTLRQHYARGDSAQLVKTAKELLADLTLQAIDSSCCDYERFYYEVAFTAFDAAGTETLARLLIHEPDPEQAVVPGLKGDKNPLYVVFVAENDSVEYRAAYDLEPEENPLLKEASDFAALALGRFALPTATALANVRKAAPAAAAPAPVYPASVTLLKAVFPYGRAKVTARHAVAIVDPVRHVTGQVGIVTAALPTADPTQPAACAQLAQSLGSEIDATAKAACAYSTFDTASCWTALKEKVSAAYDAAMAGSSACSGPAAYRIAGRYAPFVAAPPKQLATTAVISNTPLRWASFSLATTVISGIEPDADKPRARVSNGTIVADTFSRFLPLGLFNVMPWKYDGKAINPDWHERLRLSAGVALTPYMGVSLGGGWNFSRTLGVTIARARIWYDTPKSSQRLDSPPADPDKAVPMRLASTEVWVWGLTYAVK